MSVLFFVMSSLVCVYVYSDSPVKCNNYWGGGVSGGVSATRYMFCCRVLLGEIKVSQGMIHERERSRHVQEMPLSVHAGVCAFGCFCSCKGQ